MVLTVGDINYPITFTVSADELQSTVNGLFGWDDVRKSISKSLDKLNADGQQEAVKRVEELTEIPRYRRQEPADSAENIQDCEVDEYGDRYGEGIDGDRYGGRRDE